MSGLPGVFSARLSRYSMAIRKPPPTLCRKPCSGLSKTYAVSTPKARFGIGLPVSLGILLSIIFGQGEWGTSPRKSLPIFPKRHPSPRENDWDLDRAISFLDSDAQELLRLKYQGILTARKIAMRMGITEEAVESRLVRARKEVREILIRLGGKSHA